MSPLIKYPDKTIVLPIQYFGSIDYYARMAAVGHVIINDCARFDKRFKSAHRCTIADTHGELQLTVPISKSWRKTNVASAAKPCQSEESQQLGQQGELKEPEEQPRQQLTWRNVGLSDHGMWWQDIEVSIASAYGRTPFYEYYIDRLRPFFSKSTIATLDSIASLDVALNRTICSILGITSDIRLRSEISDAEFAAATENLITADEIVIEPVEYYQVRHDRFGFIAGLSILDLIFNMGPESPLTLHRMVSEREVAN